jgi:hypothetical protein
MQALGEAAGLAVGAVCADEHGRGEGFGAVGCGPVTPRNVEFYVRGEFAYCEYGVYLLERGAASVAASGEGLVEAELVEALAEGHGADGVAGADADLAGLVRCWEIC